MSEMPPRRVRHNASMGMARRIFSMADSYARPCCGYLTRAKPACGSYDICPVCFWEDDAVQLADPDYEGGANGPSLRQAQRYFAEHGACDAESLKHVRD